MSVSSRHRFPILLGLLTASISAQEVAYWNTQSLPGALTAPVTAFGTQITIRTNSVVMMYSGVLHTWTTLPLSPTSTVFADYNDHVIVRDGGTIHAWSPRTGQVSTINVSPLATLLTGVAGRTWVAAVQDGSTVYGYASFTGTWRAITTASTSPTITLNKVTLLVQDGVGAFAMSAYYGTWSSRPDATLRSVQENLALLSDGADNVRAYSAYTDHWISTSFPGASTAQVTSTGNTYALLRDGSRVLGYSAARDTFAVYTGQNPATGVVASLEAVGFFDGGTVVCFGSSTGTFATLSGTVAPTLVPAENRFGCFMLIRDTNAITAYSAVKGAYSATLTGSFTTTLSDASILAQSATATYGYSATSNQWIQAPAFNATGGYPLYDGAVLTGPTGMLGFSVRLNAWHATSAIPGTIETHGALLVSRSGNHADYYDPRLGVWGSIDAAAAFQPFSVWRLMTVTHDGTRAHGFSLFAGTPDSTPLQGNVVEYRANSEIGYVLTDTHIQVFSGTGSLSARYRFPEHSREPRAGVPLWLQQTAAPGSYVWTTFGREPTVLDLGTLGRLFVAPSSILLTTPIGAVPGSGVLDFAFTPPANPALIGERLELQNIVVPLSGSIWLTNSTSPIFL